MAKTNQTLAERCRQIEFLVLDVDGVLTDGSIVYDDQNGETKAFHVRDGAGLRIWQMMGKRSAIITGRQSAIVERRAQETGVTAVIQGATEKLPALAGLLARENLKPEQTCFVGDDIPDLPVLKHCGLAVAVPDACPEVLTVADYITQTPGGKGAVRETIELILRCQGLWRQLVARFESQSVS
jgi:3-deoxy-D-manno-octulosonate 8-phosphate phosphatase (KDO 8-P phosphatase)